MRRVGAAQKRETIEARPARKMETRRIEEDARMVGTPFLLSWAAVARE
jgi:hypothetical protein